MLTPPALAGEGHGGESSNEPRNAIANSLSNEKRKNRRTRYVWACVSVGVALLLGAALGWWTWDVSGPIAAVVLALAAVESAVVLILTVIHFVLNE